MPSQLDRRVFLGSAASLLFNATSGIANTDSSVLTLFPELIDYRQGITEEYRSADDYRGVGLDISLTIPLKWKIFRLGKRFSRRNGDIWIGGEVSFFENSTRVETEKIIPKSALRLISQVWDADGHPGSLREFGNSSESHIFGLIYTRCATVTFVYKGGFNAVMLAIQGPVEQESYLEKLYAEVRPDFTKMLQSLKVHGLLRTDPRNTTSR